jgi:hypothetical protein
MCDPARSEYRSVAAGRPGCRSDTCAGGNGFQKVTSRVVFHLHPPEIVQINADEKKR